MRRKNDIPTIYQPKPKTDPTARAVRYYDTDNKRRTKFLGHDGTEDFRRRVRDFWDFYYAMLDEGLDAESFKAKKETLEEKSYTLGEVLIWAWDNVVPRLYIDENGKKKREWSAAQMVVTELTKELHHKRMDELQAKDLRDIWVRWAGSGSLQGSTVRARIVMLKRLLKEVMFERREMIDKGTLYELTEWRPPAAFSNSAENRGVREKEQAIVATDEEIIRMIQQLEETDGEDSIASLIFKTIRTSSIRPKQLIEGGRHGFLPVEYVEVRSDCVLIYPDPKSKKREARGPDLYISTDPEVIAGFAERIKGKSKKDPVFQFKVGDDLRIYSQNTYNYQIQKARKKIQKTDPNFRDIAGYALRHRAKDVMVQSGMPEDIRKAVMNHTEQGIQKEYGTRRLEAPIREGVEVLAKTWRESLFSFSQ